MESSTFMALFQVGKCLASSIRIKDVEISSSTVLILFLENSVSRIGTELISSSKKLKAWLESSSLLESDI